jgi:hypothetical protein
VADKQQQSAPLGLAGDTSKKNKKPATTQTEKTRLADEKKKQADTAPDGTATSPAPQTPAPATAPTPQPQQ